MKKYKIRYSAGKVCGYYIADAECEVSAIAKLKKFLKKENISTENFKVNYVMSRSLNELANT